MTTDEIIKTLIAHRDRLNRAISALQDTPVGKRRGRAPKASSPAGRRPNWTPAQRRAQAERMRQYWADRKGAKGTGAKAAKK